MKVIIPTGEQRTVQLQGEYLYIPSATGPVALTIVALDGSRTSRTVRVRFQVRVAGGIREIELDNLHTASNTVEVQAGTKEFIPSNDGQKVTLTGQDVVIEVVTNPASPLDVVGPLTDAELRATPVPVTGTLTVDTSAVKLNIKTTGGDTVAVTGPVTDAELRATPVIVDRATVMTRHRLIAAATTNATSVKATPGKVYSLNGTNTSGATCYLKFYDKATAPTVGTDTPVETYALPAGAPFHFDFAGIGSVYLVGIAFAVTAAAADADTTAIAAGDVIMTTHYE